MASDRRRLVTRLGKKAMVYGPAAKLVWDAAGGTVTTVAQRAWADRSARSKAVAHAETLNQGAVLRTMHGGDHHWVVFSAGEPVTAYPDPGVPLSALVERADLNKLMTPEQVQTRAREQGLRGRAGQATGRVRRQLRRSELPPDIERD